MAQELTLSPEETAALDRVENQVRRSAPSAAALKPEDLCKKYHELKGSLEIIVKLVKKIPGIGGKIAAALEFLMGLADVVCPV